MSKGEDLYNAYFDSMEDFVRICSDVTHEAVKRNKYNYVYLDDVDEIVQQVCYLMLVKSNLNRETFKGENGRMFSYVYTLIKSCIVRLSWGRDKYGAGYILR